MHRSTARVTLDLCSIYTTWAIPTPRHPHHPSSSYSSSSRLGCCTTGSGHEPPIPMHQTPHPTREKQERGGGGTLTIPKAHVDVHPALPRRYPPLIADRDIEHAPALAVFFLSRGLFERFRITLHAREFRKQEKTGGGGSADIHRWM